MKGYVFLAMMLFVVAGVRAYELNSLNTVEYVQGQTIELSTRVLAPDAYVVADASCQTYVTKDTDNSIILNTVNMTYDDVSEHYVYFWVPELTFWEGIEQMWNPAVGNYHSYVVCTGGALGGQTLIDVVEVRVVE